MQVCSLGNSDQCISTAAKGLKQKTRGSRTTKKFLLLFRGLILDTFGEIVVLIVALKRSKV